MQIIEGEKHYGGLWSEHSYTVFHNYYFLTFERHEMFHTTDLFITVPKYTPV